MSRKDKQSKSVVRGPITAETDILGSSLSWVQRRVRGLAKRVGLDAVESSYAESIAWSTLRQPTTKGLFGGSVVDKELLFGAQREPAAFRITFGVAKDALDNWFSIQDTADKPDEKLDADIQKELSTLHAKTQFIRLLGLARLYGWSLLLIGYEDQASKLSEAVPEDAGTKIKYIEPYPKTDVRRVAEVSDPEDERDGYPEFYEMKIGTKLSEKIHWTRTLHCAPNLVDHRWKGWSELQVIYDDLMGFRYLRWGVYMTMVRYGSGFPDVTLKGEDVTQAKIDEFLASGAFDNLNCNKYFVHNERQELKMWGAQGSTLNPLQYYQIALESIALGSGIPEPVLRGAQAGALTGSEVNERAYFKVVSDVQTGFEPILRQLIDKILRYLGKGEIEYKIVWKPGFEPTEREKADVANMDADAAMKELGYKGLDEVRKSRNLKELETDESRRIPFRTAVAPGANPFAFPGQSTSTDAEPVKGPDPKPKPTLVVLLQQLGKAVIDGDKTKDQALAEGTVIVNDFAKLEEQHAILYLQHRTSSPKPVTLTPELDAQLKRQRKKYLADLDAMLTDAEKLHAGKSK